MTIALRTTPAAPRLRLTRRGRAVVGALALVPAITVLGVALLDGPGAVATGEPVTGDYSYATVQTGESLWQLAESIAPEADPRVVIDDIVALNQLSGSSVEAGQRLAIPTQYDF